MCAAASSSRSPRRCAACGAPLEGRRSQVKTCSSACRQLDYRRRLQEREQAATAPAPIVRQLPRLTRAGFTTKALAARVRVAHSIANRDLAGIVELTPQGWRLTPAAEREYGRALRALPELAPVRGAVAA
jgi:endogenous inhibitor of DNA gyrase (YacG/DUF329 family)